MIETEATGAPQKHHHTLNQYVGSITLSKILIPVPSMEIQERIVSILDKFDTLTNSITEGLPREIELRQKQYEYYRDLLFSFPKPETASN
nr:restriction endonuclease subunit S [Escherichia coli]